MSTAALPEVPTTPALPDLSDVEDHNSPDLTPVATEAELAACDVLRDAAYAALTENGTKPLDKTAAPLFTREALVRYLRARRSTSKNVSASVKMMVASAKWRQEYDLEAKLKEWADDTSPEAMELRKAWPCGVFGVDVRGCPVYYARYGLIDLAALEKRFGFERILRLALTEQRQIELGLEVASRAHGKHLVQVVCVADFEGMQWSRALRAVPIFKRLSNVLDSHFPERLHVGFVARAPGLFSGIYKLVEPFLAPDTRAKARICGKSEDHVGALSQLVPRGNIPAFLGGDAALCPIGDGSVATSSSVPPPPKSEQPQQHQSHAEGVGAPAASPAVNAEPRAPSSAPSSASGEAAAAVVAAAVAEVSSGSRVGQST